MAGEPRGVGRLGKAEEEAEEEDWSARTEGSRLDHLSKGDKEEEEVVRR